MVMLVMVVVMMMVRQFGKSGQQKWLWLGLIKRVMRALTGTRVGCTALGLAQAALHLATITRLHCTWLALGCTWLGRKSLAEQSVDSAQLWF